MTSTRVLAVGEINPDIVVRGVRGMSFGQAEDLVEETVITVGSSVAIMACGAVRLGARVALVGVIGDDTFGRYMTTRLGDRGVDVSALRLDRHGATGSSVVLVSASDATDRQILTHAGTMTSLTAGDVTQGLLLANDHLHIGSWFLHASARDQLGGRLALARILGLSTSVDPNHDPAREWDGGLQSALGEVELLFCNEAEACGLTGLTDPDVAARELLSRLALDSLRPALPAVVLKLGSRGARVYHAGGITSVEAPIVHVTDTIGAGDTLAAGVLAHVVQEGDWERLLPFAVAAASLSTRGVGGVDAQPYAEEARQLSTQLFVTTTEGAS